MSLMPSLCAALERAGGERLVMRAGERPHVLAGERRHDVASAVLSVNAVEALAEQILSSAARHELTTNGTVNEPVHSSSFPHPLMARAERVGDDFCIELIVSKSVEAPPVQPEPETSQVPSEPEISYAEPTESAVGHVTESTPAEPPVVSESGTYARRVRARAGRVPNLRRSRTSLSQSLTKPHQSRTNPNPLRRQCPLRRSSLTPCARSEPNLYDDLRSRW